MNDKFSSLREDYNKYPKKREKILKLVRAIKTGASFKCYTKDCFEIVKKEHGWCPACKDKYAPKLQTKNGKRRYTIEEIQARLLEMRKREILNLEPLATNATGPRTIAEASQEELEAIFHT